MTFWSLDEDQNAKVDCPTFTGTVVALLSILPVLGCEVTSYMKYKGIVWPNGLFNWAQFITALHRLWHP